MPKKRVIIVHPGGVLKIAKDYEYEKGEPVSVLRIESCGRGFRVQTDDPYFTLPITGLRRAGWHRNKPWEGPVCIPRNPAEMKAFDLITRQVIKLGTPKSLFAITASLIDKWMPVDIGRKIARALQAIKGSQSASIPVKIAIMMPPEIASWFPWPGMSKIVRVTEETRRWLLEKIRRIEELEEEGREKEANKIRMKILKLRLSGRPYLSLLSAERIAASDLQKILLAEGLTPSEPPCLSKPPLEVAFGIIPVPWSVLRWAYGEELDKMDRPEIASLLRTSIRKSTELADKYERMGAKDLARAYRRKRQSMKSVLEKLQRGEL